jgi:hypothetical protein
MEDLEADQEALGLCPDSICMCLLLESTHAHPAQISLLSATSAFYFGAKVSKMNPRATRRSTKHHDGTVHSSTVSCENH